MKPYFLHTPAQICFSQASPSLLQIPYFCLLYDSINLIITLQWELLLLFHFHVKLKFLPKVFLIISGRSDFSFLFTFFFKFLCILVIYTYILYIIKIFDFLKFSDKILIFESFFWDMESINGHCGPHLLASKPFISAFPLWLCSWTRDLLDQWVCSQ